MKKALEVFGSVIFCFFLSAASNVIAQGDSSSGTPLKQELGLDRQQIKEQHKEMKEDAQAAKGQESQLKQQIRDAVAAGDKQKSHQLRGQLHAVHQENVQERQQNKQAMHSARSELKSDMKEAHQGKGLPPRLDKDNNPPGPKGGQGTNWENVPGPQGGSGASPDRKHVVNKSSRPSGGPGTN